MPTSAPRTPNWTALVIATVAALGTSACDSDPPQTLRPDTAGITRISAPSYGPPPLPPQPAYQPVINRSPMRAPGPDGTLASKVEAAIGAEPALHGLNIDVTAVDGTIYLRGHALSRDGRRLATRIVTAVDGVKRVQNELFVVAGS